MANRRMISKSISISSKVNSISDFAALLFTWMIPHADDYGAMEGSPGTVRALVVPRRKQTEKQVAEALEELQKIGLIWWYVVNSRQYIQLVNFEEHQEGLQKRTKSKFPLYQDRELNVNEADVEEVMLHLLNKGELLINEVAVVAERQVRIENSYLDLVCYDAGEMVCVIELKRHKLSNAALEQIIGYKKLLNNMGKHPLLVLIGNGLAVNFDTNLASAEGVNLYGFDGSYNFCPILLNDVMCCQITSKMLFTNLTEPNLTEPKRKENTPPSGYDYFSDFWERYPRKVAKADAVKAFKKLKMTNDLMKLVMAGLSRAIKSDAWQKDDGKFVPYPATWINGRRWEDGK